MKNWYYKITCNRTYTNGVYIEMLVSELFQWQQCNYASPVENKAVICSCEGISEN